MEMECEKTAQSVKCLRGDLRLIPQNPHEKPVVGGDTCNPVQGGKYKQIPGLLARQPALIMQAPDR